MLNCESCFRKGAFIVRVSGQLNRDTCKILKRQITSVLKYCGFKKVIFNLSDLYHIDTNGINTLINNCNIIRENGGDVYFCSVNLDMRDLLKQDDVIYFDNEFNALNYKGEIWKQ